MFESKINRGRANGYAPLDSGSKVPLSYLPPIQSTIDTGSFATTGSNQFNGNQSISGSLTTAEFIQTSNIQGTGSLYLKPDSNDSRYFEIYNTSPSDTHLKANGGISFFGDDTNYLKIEDGAGDVTIRANQDITLQTGNGNIVFNPDGNVYIGSANSGNGIVTDGYLGGIIGDTSVVNNSTGHTITDNLTNIINSIPTIPIGTISGSQQIIDLGFVTGSYTTINEFNSLTQSFNSISQSFTTISGSVGGVDFGGLATTGSNTFKGNQTINGSLTLNISTGTPTGVSNWNGQGGWNQGFYSSISTTGGTGTGLTVDVAAGGGGYINISAISINNPGSGYTDGDIITIDNENNLPGSFTLQVGASSLQFNSSSVEFHDLTLNGTGSFQSDLTVYGNLKVWGTQSIINSTNVELSDNIIYLAPSGGGDYDLGIVGHYDDGTYSHTGIFSDASDGHTWKVFKGLTAESTGAFIDTNGVGFTLADFKANNIYGGIYATNGVISGSSQLTSSYDSRYVISGSITQTTWNNIASKPTGIISGSSQLTSSFDTRYLLSGSSTSRVFASDTAPSSPTQGDLWWKTNDGNLYVYYGSYWVIATDTISALPNGLVSGSSQLPTLATTGSNTFTGTNTFKSTTTFSGSVTIGAGAGYEGGEIDLAYSPTGSTLTGSFVAVDIYQDKIRIFEGGGNSRGVSIDLSKAPNGVGGELMWKTSGLVNAGTFVTLDNIKATVTSSGNRGLSIAAVSTSFTANISAYHAYSGGVAGTSSNNQSITTTASLSLFGWSFPAEADGSYYNILDKTNNRFYRITLMIGASYNNNFISIERLY